MELHWQQPFIKVMKKNNSNRFNSITNFIFLDNLAMVKLLIHFKADVNKAAYVYDTTLMYAVKLGNLSFTFRVP